MLGWFITMVWVGGWLPRYQRSRQIIGLNVVGSCMDALFWPWDLGHYLSKNFALGCGDDEEHGRKEEEGENNGT